MNLPSVFFPETRCKIAQKIMFTLQSYLNFKLFLTTACYGNAYFFRFGWASWIFHINLCISWDSNLIFDHFKIKIDNDVQNNSKISYSVAKKFSTFLMGSNFISMKKTTTEKINAEVWINFKIKKPLDLFHHNYWHEWKNNFDWLGLTFVHCAKDRFKLFAQC